MGPEGILAPSFQSSILYLGRPVDNLLSLGLEVTNNVRDLKTALKNHTFKVLILEYERLDAESSVDKTLVDIKKLSPKSQIVLVGNSLEPRVSISLFNRNLVQFISSQDSLQIESHVNSAINSYDSIEQDDSFFKLFDDQNERLSLLKSRLEDRVIKRQKFLNSARSKLSITDRNVGLLHKCFVAIHGAQSFLEIESKLVKVLGDALQILSINISIDSISNQQVEADSDELRTLSYALIAEDREFGKVQFARDIRQPYSDQEDSLLSQVSGAISLASIRLMVLGELEKLTNQWEITFSSISDPLCLLDQKFKIIRGNLSLGTMFKKDQSDLIGQSPFDLLNIPEPNQDEMDSGSVRKRIETEFEGENYTFDIIVQTISQPSQAPVMIVIFRDVTQTALLEKQALESSKLAELGIIGSSIAHELNNPLGGIINFLQLIKMDLESNHPIFEDIQEMEKAAHRCKQIVENLLGFSRHENPHDSSEFHLDAAIDQAIRICEIQTKSMGIKVDWKPEVFHFTIHGNKNQWIQAIRNLLQNSIDAIGRKSKTEPEHKGLISIHSVDKHNSFQIHIQDNGDGIEERDLPLIFNPLFSRKDGPNSSGLGLTVAFRILNEHHANLFYKSVPLSGTTAIISLKSPEIQGSSQVFDTKI